MAEQWRGIKVDGKTPAQQVKELRRWFREPEALVKRMRGLVDNARDEAARQYWQEVLTLLTTQLTLPL